MMRMAVRLAGRWDRDTPPRLTVLLVVLGLLTPTILRVLGPDGAAWLPDHGHIFLTSEAARHVHSHPWDEHPPASASVAGADAVPDVLFTVGDLDGANSFAVLALPVVALAAFAVAWAGDRVEAPPPLAAGRRLAPLAPPPQG